MANTTTEPNNGSLFTADGAPDFKVADLSLAVLVEMKFDWLSTKCQG